MSQANEKLAVEFIEAFGRGDREALTGYLTEDVVFESPRVRLAGVAEVSAAIAGFGTAITELSIETVFADEHRALVAYTMMAGPLGPLRAVDRLEFRDGRIAADTVVFDTYPVRRAEAPGRGTEATVIQYRTLPEAADANEKLVADVFEQLAAEDPGGVRYVSLRLDDGVGFVHVVINEPGGTNLTELSSFAEFQREFSDRVPDGPTRSGAKLIGQYRMVG
ncbi:nuclear transport factor 2 family protein [Stackebrandtia nassauensis]|uniref:SnoaL-like domain-containing protein n=1 Tax=Stackebrandtia nassauensis (strain DSM 44728 / CIP 108903 / NRRL B-16338 / NBRC 102104 / LLR-40K-21) TaxID=446470 RepID=D3Q3M3_STANL|nr:nuclear transport factor 2 family protein [Stackebrandtia nassauensis]ADD43940.1 protein of unknown function DUF1486 [Stackebrandtia nassauensis DSM 44728]